MFKFPSRLRPRKRGHTLALVATAGVAAALLPVLGTSADAAPADTDTWTEVAGRVPTTKNGHERRVDPSAFRAYTLNDASLAATLSRAPQGDAGSGVTLTVPAPTGDLVDFTIAEAPIMESGLAAAHPEISTYAGRATEGSATIRLDVTPMGFHASVRGDGASWYIDPAWNGDDSLYLSYLGTDLPADETPLVEPEIDEDALGALSDKLANGPSAAEDNPGDAVIHRTYRLALVTDPSYARYFGTENVLAEKVTLMNRVNQIYNDDLAINMILIDDTDKLNLDTEEKAFGPEGECGAAGCYVAGSFGNGCTGSLLTRNRYALGQLVGATNYDIGHIMLGINGGGVANLGVVGGTSKGGGCTGLPQPEGDFMAIDYVAHEMGHQFGGNHTFNGTQYNCGGNKAAPSVEPGSGSSVMAYAGICQQDNLQPHTDPYFSQWTQQEVSAYIGSDRAAANEVVNVALDGFDTDGESFTLTYDGATTAPIVRGTDYTAAGIAAALAAVLPEGGTVSVARLSGGGGALADIGFQLTFSGSSNPLSGTDLPAIGFTSADATAVVGETVKGGPIQNGGYVTEESSNHTPVASAPASKTIPLRTPFALTGSATDADSDQMIYLWEQSDRGAGAGTSLVSQTKTNGPLFRVFGTFANVTPAGTLLINSPGENIAGSDPTRVFPDMEQILINNTNAETGTCPDAPAPPATGGASNVPVPTVDCFSEWLPTADYVGSTQAGNNDPVALNFRFTARDLDPQAGGYSFANTKLLIDKTAGPFLVKSKNTPAGAVGGRSEVVTWDVAGTDKPELAENVSITLSTDGGRTYPHVLVASTPNDGTEAVTWPNLNTTTARIKIQAVDNVFFDVNNADFEIVARTVEGPDTSLSGPKNGSILLANATTMTASSTKDGSTFACTLDGTAVDCADGVAALKGLSTGTHVFTAAATDADGHVDQTPARTAFTVAADDRALVKVKGDWKQKADKSAYRGTITTVAKPKARVKYAVSNATSISLVVTKGPKQGGIKVYFRGQLLKQISLKAPKAKKQQIIKLGSFNVPARGNLVIETRTKTRVMLDGIAVVSPTP